MNASQKTTFLDVLTDGSLYAFYMLGSCLVWMVAEACVIKVLTLCFEIDYFTLCIIRASIYTIGVSAMLFTAAYREGYKAAGSSIVGSALSCVLGSLLHFLPCLLFSFNPFCAGGVKFVTALIKFGPSLSSSSFMGELVRLDYFPAFFATALLYCVVMTAAKRIGAVRRLADRKEMTANQNEI